MAWLRHTSVVAAGVASVALTGAAASVVLSALGAKVTTDDLFNLLTPPLFDHPSETTHESGTDTDVLATVRREPTVPLAAATPALVGVPAPATPAYTATVQVDDYFLAANLERLQPTEVDVAVTTNVFDIVPESIRRLYDPDPDTTGPTTLRTEHNLRTGVLTITASDPEIGEYSIVLAPDLLV